MARQILTIILLLAYSSANAGESSIIEALQMRQSTPEDLQIVFGENAKLSNKSGEMESWRFQDGQVQGIADYRQGKLDQLLIFLPYDSPELEAMGGVENVMRASSPTIFVDRDDKGISLTLKTAARLRDETGETMQVMTPPPRKLTSIELKGFRRGWTEARTLEPGRYIVETRQKWIPERFGSQNHFVVWMHSDAGKDLVANDHGHTVESTYVTLANRSSVSFLVEKCGGAWTIDVKLVSSTH